MNLPTVIRQMLLEFSQEPILIRIVRACITNYRERLVRRQRYRLKIELRKEGNLLHYELEVFVRGGVPRIEARYVTRILAHDGVVLQLPQQCFLYKTLFGRTLSNQWGSSKNRQCPTSRGMDSPKLWVSGLRQ